MLFQEEGPAALLLEQICLLATLEETTISTEEQMPLRSLEHGHLMIGSSEQQ